MDCAPKPGVLLPKAGAGVAAELAPNKPPPNAGVELPLAPKPNPENEELAGELTPKEKAIRRPVTCLPQEPHTPRRQPRVMGGSVDQPRTIWDRTLPSAPPVRLVSR